MATQHFYCAHCNTKSSGSFIWHGAFGPINTGPRCLNDDCPAAWWNKPAINNDLDHFFATDPLVVQLLVWRTENALQKIQQRTQGELT